MRYELVLLRELKQHEKTKASRMKEIKKSIAAERMMKNPIIADRKSMVILDGHHRYNAALSLGLERIPTILVNYSSPSIKVYSRRRNIKVTKEIIIQRGKNNRPFPPKTTRHVIPGRKAAKVPLEKLV